jgi:hypothetical protein
MESHGSVMTKGATMNWRRLRWSLAIMAVTLEIAAFVVWRVWLRRRGR